MLCENYTLYEKVGRRYIPVKEYDNKIHDAFPEGFSLVHSKPGSTSFRYNVDPACIEVLAAMRLMEDAMVDAMREASKWAPNKPLTTKQRAAYDAYAESMGDGIYLLYSKSAHDVVEAGMKVLQERIRQEV